MKKTVISLLVCSAFMGCSQKSPYVGQIQGIVNERTVKMPPKMASDSDIDSDSDAETPSSESEGPMKDEDSCNPKGPKDQCTLIPLEPKKCLGCADGLGHRPVNKQTAMGIMEPLKGMCIPKMKEFKGPKKGAPMDESCQFNAAECSAEGKCVGITLSQEELKKRMPKMPQGGQRGPGMMSQER